jgi:hypothetical protein
VNLNVVSQNSNNLKNVRKTSKYIDQASSLNYIPSPNNLEVSIKKHNYTNS